jgi:hypothetical protein
MKSQTGDLLIKEIFKELEIKFHYTLTKNAVKFEVKIIYPNGDGDSFQTFFLLRICDKSKRNTLITNLDYIGPSNEILGWEGVGNRRLFCSFKM